MSNKILIIDDEEEICKTLSKILINKGYDVTTSSNSTQAENEIKKNIFDLVLLDVWLEGSKKNGLELLKTIKNYHPNTQVIVISGHGSIEMAVNAIKKGAFYFLEKPFTSEKIFLLIKRALENAFLKKEYEVLKTAAIEEDEIIGSSSLLNNLKKDVKKLSATNARIFIKGETGTGKELFARSIHKISSRSEKPFIKINCSSLYSENFSKIFFGDFEKKNKTIGYIQKANGGTIFLNEICDMSYDIQGKFASFLQEEKYTPSGEFGKFDSNVRFISSSSKDPKEEIKNKRLRQDLYYRLSVASLEIPSLNKRKEDVPSLFDYFVLKTTKNKFLKKIKLTQDAYSTLQSLKWPGNVMQIKNLVDWLYIMYRDEIKKTQPISVNQLPKELFGTTSKNVDKNKKGDLMMNLTLKEARKEFEKKYLINQVNRFSGNISKTASFIGMERSALHRKIKDIGVKK